MSTQLFQQFVSLLQEADSQLQNQEFPSYDVLVDELYVSIENQIKFYTHRFDQIMNLFYALLQNYQAQGTTLTICSHLFEIFVMMVQRRPVLIGKNTNRLLNMVQKLFEMFNMLDFEQSQAWMKPIQGYLDQQDFSQQASITKQIMSFFDRIAQAYTYPKFIQFFNEILPGWFTNSQNNWKSKYTLLMVMSQLGQDIQYPLLIKSYVECGINSSNHPHPKVRYAVLQMFGQLSDDMKPDFQEMYGQQVLPIIISLAKDQVPRVQSHAMACLTNFLEDFQTSNYHVLSPFVDQIIGLSQEFFVNGMSYLKQNTASTLASLSTVDLLTQQQVDKILNIIHHSLTYQVHQKSQYNQLINQTIQCLSMVLYGQSNSKVLKYLDQSVNIIKSLKQRLSGSYFVNSWSRICLKYENFTDLSDVFPYVLFVVTSMIQNYQSDLQSAIGSIQNTITSFKSNVKPFANDIINFCKNGVNKLEKDGKQKHYIYNIINQLIKTLKCQAPDPQWEETSKSLFTFFYQQVQKGFNEEQVNDYVSLQSALQGLQGIIENVQNLFSPDNLNIFSSKILSFSQKITGLINSYNNQILVYNNQLQQTTDQLDQEDLNQLIEIQKQGLNKLFTCRLIIPDIYLSLLKVIPSLETKVQLVQSLYSHVGQYLDSSQHPESIRYGIYFLCNFIDQLKYQGIQQYAQIYQEKFCQFTISPSIQVRNCAVYGLGVFIKVIPVQKTNQDLIYKWLNLLWNSLNFSYNEIDKKKCFNFARDNIVSALGKFIISKRVYYPNALNQQVVKKWFQNLPLNNDKIQGNVQHEILLTLLNQSPQLLISSKQDIFALLNIFAKYFLKRGKKKQDIIVQNRKKTKQYLLKMKDWQIFQQNSDYLWNQLPINHKNVLTQLMSEMTD